MDDFKPLFEYVEKNIENKMGLKELADFMGYSPYYISRKFIDLYGIPVTAYVRIRKLQYSIKDLLADMKVIDVAMKYSFESHEGFSRSFKSLFGSSPKDIKKHLLKYDIPEIELFANYKTKSMEEEKMSLSDDMHKMIYTILGNSFEEMTGAFVQKLSLACCRIIALRFLMMAAESNWMMTGWFTKKSCKIFFRVSRLQNLSMPRWETCLLMTLSL